MRSVLALLRANWLAATSYRLATVLSLVSLAVSIVPIHFVARAVQPVAAESIRLEGGQYFGFVVLGLALLYVVASATAAIPAALGANIGNGTLEAMLATRAPLPAIVAGLAAYPVVQSLVRALLLVVVGTFMGVAVDWTRLPWAAAVVALLIAAHAAVGLVAGALVLVFRTAGPIVTGVIAASGLLGGVYYSTQVIPGWLQRLSDIVPLTYALRAVRRLLLTDAPVADVLPDVGMLALLAATGGAIGLLAFGAALTRARRAGTLAQY